ncbi:hypothetical protein I3F59_008545 [Streptomyces sp. MUM 178J]|nr:hypothetical protein [Streptomyces sp. MUM 178J]WRQ83306.1 hypothetical protein I3F59_008545 [Streptomyces sp. MUM 178J]
MTSVKAAADFADGPADAADAADVPAEASAGPGCGVQARRAEWERRSREAGDQPQRSVDADTVPAGEEAGAGARGEEQTQSKLWHITLSVSGPRAPLKEVRRALEQLAHDHPFLLTSRYADDHAEIRYWEEARDLHDAAAVALRLWGEHRSTAKLPPWKIVGLEVIDRQTYHQRVAEGYGPPPASPVGVHPF